MSHKIMDTVKNYLDITWSDKEQDKKLYGIIERGKKYLDNIAGCALDYTVNDKPLELLLDYCRYVMSNALDEFAVNYRSELIMLQIKAVGENGNTEENKGV